ncbi:MAG: hypothetical protein U9Q03_04535 [Patescibacteria group bacterium]|nr:hypothetical protein [Patescibacteria group bacterium]
MAIQHIPNPDNAPEDQMRSFAFDNGDLTALRDAMEKYRFRDEEAMFRFALVALLRAEDNIIYVDEGDKTVELTPAPDLINQE